MRITARPWVITLLVGGTVCWAAIPHPAAPRIRRTSDASEARIIVDARHVGARVPDTLFGANHRYAYDGFGMWDAAPSAPYPRFDRRLLTAGISALRFPGGTIANTYHWKRAIGPPGNRTLNVHGRTGARLTNELGPDEFGRFVTERNLEGIVVVNFATGDAEEAADLVEYMNAPLGTNPNGGIAWANMRATNGRPDPYAIRYWEVGNEMYMAHQSYWMGDGSRLDRARKYAFGGSTRFVDQPVGKPWDHRLSAAKSNGSTDQMFQVLYPPVRADEGVTVTVDGAEWMQALDLQEIGPGHPAYEFDFHTGTIRFGDGRHGAIPPNGAIVKASYMSGPHDGFVDFYQAMKSIDPAIEIGSSLRSKEFLSLMGADHRYDFVAAHVYSHRPPRGYDTPAQFHDGVMLLADRRANAIRTQQAALTRFAGARASDIEVLVTEYGLFFGKWPGPTDHYLLSVDHALYVTLQLLRWAQLGVPLAAKHSLIDFSNTSAPEEIPALGHADQAVIGPAPGFTASATARAFQLLKPLEGASLVQTLVYNNPIRQTYLGRLKLLRAQAARSLDGSLFLLVVNKDRTREVPATILARGTTGDEVSVRFLMADSYLSYNTEEEPNEVSVRRRLRTASSGRVTLRFPPHSVTLLRLTPAG